MKRLTLDSNFPPQFEETRMGIRTIEKAIARNLGFIGEFEILDPVLVPDGLKPIARSISWLIEQIIIQNLKKNKERCGLQEVADPPHELTPYDCILRLKDDETRYHVNIKTSLTTTKHTSRFDISKADKLIQLYGENKDIILVVVIAKVGIKGVRVRFTDTIVFNVAWTPDMYYNRANHNLQSKCDGTQTPRTNADFVEELKRLMEESGHSIHY